MFVGIDVGGTNLKAGLVDDEGRLIAAARRPLNGFTTAEAFAADLAELALRAVQEGGAKVEDLESVGIGLPGAVDGGEVVYTANIPMKNVPLERLFRQHLDVPVYLGNDADCAAVGEFFGGVGRGCRDFVVVTLGTGVGVGIIRDGKLQGGAASSEAGHMVIQQGGELCNCGRRGCWERYASATALIQQTRAAMEAHPDSGLYQTAEALGAVDGRTAFQAALAGDETALAVCRQYVAYLANGATSLINILRPEAVAIGGGVAAAPEALLLAPLREIVARECYARHGGRVTRVLRAELGNDAGIIGAALLQRVV